MELKLFDSLPNEAKYIRTQVFTIEQGFKNEFDETDNVAHHILCYVDDKPVGTARFFTDNKGNYHIGRLAVLKEYRNMKLGAKIINFATNEIKKLGGKNIELSSQVRVKNFYKKCGFVEEGEEYLDEFCPHIKMVKSL